MTSLQTLRYGQIVLVNVSDGQWNTKVRPVVIVTPTDEITSGSSINAVCISTQIEDPIPTEHIKLPWANPRYPRTGLNKPNVAKCNWIATFPASSVIRIMGMVPYSFLREIAEILSDRITENENKP